MPLYTDKLIDECRSLPDYVEAAKCVMLVFGDAKRSAELITKGLQTGRGLNAKSCRDTLITMKELGLSKEDISAFQVSSPATVAFALIIACLFLRDLLFVFTTPYHNNSLSFWGFYS